MSNAAGMDARGGELGLKCCTQTTLISPSKFQKQSWAPHSSKRTFSREEICDRNPSKTHLKKPRNNVTVSKHGKNTGFKIIIEFPRTRMLPCEETAQLSWLLNIKNCAP